MSEPTVEIAAVPGENQEEPPTEDGDAEKRRIMKEQEAQLAAKYGMLKPNVSSVVQRRISRGGKGQFFDSGEYNKNKKKEGGAASANDSGTSQAPVAVTPGGPAIGPSHLSALPKRMQRKPSGASRLGAPSLESPPKD